MIALIFASMALANQSEPAASAYPRLDPEAQARLESCEVDAARFDALMALDPQSFDQDFSGGWRPVGDKTGCARAAAALLIAYMDHSPHFNQARPGVIGWHAGQMLAMAGQVELAIPYFEAKRSGEASPMVDALKIAGVFSPALSKAVAGFWSRNELSKHLPVNVSTCISNVPGPDFPLYCAGARLVDYYGLGVLTPGMGIFHLVFSYSGKITLSVLADRDIMPDPEFYHDCLVAAYEETYAAIIPLQPKTVKAKELAAKAKIKTPRRRRGLKEVKPKTARKKAPKSKPETGSKTKLKKKAGAKSAAASATRANSKAKSSAKPKAKVAAKGKTRSSSVKTKRSAAKSATVAKPKVKRNTGAKVKPKLQ